jgi:hypothetical protein
MLARKPCLGITAGTAGNATRHTLPTDTTLRASHLPQCSETEPVDGGACTSLNSARFPSLSFVVDLAGDDAAASRGRTRSKD